MKIGPVEKILIALSIIVVLASFVFAVRAIPNPDSVVVLKTLNMTCGSCASAIERTLLGKPGVSEVMVDVAAGQVIAIYDARITNSDALAEFVSAAGYKSGVVQSLSLQRYREITGETGLDKKPPKKGGCGKECC